MNPTAYEDGLTLPVNPTVERAFRRGFADGAEHVVGQWMNPDDRAFDPWGDIATAERNRQRVRQRFAARPGGAVAAARARGAHHALVFATQVWDETTDDRAVLLLWASAVQQWAAAPIRPNTILPPPRPEDALPMLESNKAGQPVVAPRTSRASASKPETSGPIILTMADVEPQEVSWLWPGRFPLGRISLLVGRPGEGKSFLTTDMAARVSTGTPWPDGATCPRGDVLLMACEDDPGDTIRPRLDAAEADCRRVHLLKSVIRPSVNGDQEFLISLADTDEIAAGLAQFPDSKLLVVDPVGSFLGGKTDAHRDNEVRSVLAPIARLAEEYGVAVLLVAHRRKSFGGHADDTALGSRAFTGIARTVWHLSRDPNNRCRRLLLPGKSNLSAEGTGLAFSISGLQPRLVWESDAVAMSADDGLHAEQAAMDRKPGPQAEAQDDAVEWLKNALADGPRATKELFDEWKNGQGGSKRTMDRAKAKLGVEPYRETIPGPWFWRLPNIANQGCQPPNTGELGNLGNLAENPRVLPLLDGQDSKVAKLSLLGNLGTNTLPLGGAA